MDGNRYNIHSVRNQTDLVTGVDVTIDLHFKHGQIMKLYFYVFEFSISSCVCYGLI